MGSIMIEENVVSAAGASACASERDLRYQIREAGFIPQQRDILYNYVYRDDIDEIDRSDSMKLKQLSVAFAD
jgi:cyclic dehypoxanthinyl futalosine synthase